MPSSPAAPNPHPLAPVTGEEIVAAREIVFASGRAEVPNEALRFAYIGLCDPPKEMVRNVDAGKDVVVDRRLRLVLLQGPVADVAEVTV
jgi:Cu2+-containing amine oxidase